MHVAIRKALAANMVLLSCCVNGARAKTETKTTEKDSSGITHADNPPPAPPRRLRHNIGHPGLEDFGLSPFTDEILDEDSAFWDRELQFPASLGSLSPTGAPTTADFERCTRGGSPGPDHLTNSGGLVFPRLFRNDFICFVDDFPRGTLRRYRFGVDGLGRLGWWGIEDGGEDWELFWDAGVEGADFLQTGIFGSIYLEKDGEAIWSRGCVANGLHLSIRSDEVVLREDVSSVDPPYVLWQLSREGTTVTETDKCRELSEEAECKGEELKPGETLMMNEYICRGRYKWGVGPSGKIEHLYQLDNTLGRRSRQSHALVYQDVGEEGVGNYVIAQMDGNVVQYDADGKPLWSIRCSSEYIEAYVTLRDTDSAFSTVTITEKCGRELWESGRDFVQPWCYGGTSTDYDDCRGTFLFPGDNLPLGAAICYADQAFGLGEGNKAGRLGQYEDGFGAFGLYRTLGGWDSEANGVKLTIQKGDGNLVLRDESNAATWSTGCRLRGDVGKHILWKNQDIRGVEVYNSETCEVAWRVFLNDQVPPDERETIESECFPDDI